MEGAGIKGYYVLLTIYKTITDDDKDEIQDKEISELKLINITAYNELIIAQEYTIWFQIIEEENLEDNKYGDTTLAWTTLSINFESITGASITRITKKFAKYELDDVTINPEEWITELKLHRRELQKLDVHIDDSEMMNLILSNIP